MVAVLRRPAEFDHIFKLLLIGNSGVGKSSVLLRYCGEGFDEQQLSTIGVDFRVKFCEVNSKKIKLSIWDTAGQERFRTLTSSYYKGAHGISLIYDVSERESFEALKDWLAEVNKYSTQSDAVLMLIANKIDKRKPTSTENPSTGGSFVSKAEGEGFALEHSMIYVETSAKTNEGIEQAFEELVCKILEVPSLTRMSGYVANTNSVRVESSTDETKEEGFCGC